MFYFKFYKPNNRTTIQINFEKIKVEDNLYLVKLIINLTYKIKLTKCYFNILFSKSCTNKIKGKKHL